MAHERVLCGYIYIYLYANDVCRKSKGLTVEDLRIPKTKQGLRQWTQGLGIGGALKHGITLRRGSAGEYWEK